MSPAQPTRTPYPGLERIADPDIRSVTKVLFDKLGVVEQALSGIGTMSQPLTTPLNGNGQQLKAVADPSHPQDAVTLAYLRHYVESRVHTVVTAATAPPTIPVSDGGVIPTPGTPIGSGGSSPGPIGSPSTGTVLTTDMIPPASVIVLNSPSGALAWAQTATLTVLDWSAAGVSVTFSKQTGVGRWPDILFPGSDDPTQTLQYTLWGFLQVAGQWYASGVIQFWFGLDRNGGPPSGMANNWFYDPGRWGPMSGHQPAAGETIGMMVAAGDQRNQSAPNSVLERSQIITFPFPASDGGIRVTT